jgi:hypothetical protein
LAATTIAAPFTEDEVTATIRSMHKEKAPGPDGYIGIFFKECWSLIKEDTLAAINQFYNMNQQDLRFLNQARLSLFQKNHNRRGSLILGQ